MGPNPTNMCVGHVLILNVFEGKSFAGELTVSTFMKTTPIIAYEITNKLLIVIHKYTKYR